jgi:hypothetical protein
LTPAATGRSAEQTRHTYEFLNFSRLNRSVFEKNVDKIHRKMDKALAGNPHETTVPAAGGSSCPGDVPDTGIPCGPGFDICQFAGAAPYRSRRHGPESSGSMRTRVEDIIESVYTVRR